METTQVMDLMHGSVVPLAMSYQKGFPPPPQEGMGSNLPSKSELISMCSPRDDHWFDWDLCSLCSAQSSQGKGTPPERKNSFFQEVFPEKITKGMAPNELPILPSYVLF